MIINVEELLKELITQLVIVDKSLSTPQRINVWGETQRAFESATDQSQKIAAFLGGIFCIMVNTELGEKKTIELVMWAELYY
ncbi:MAG: hypothetical protein H0T84_14230 [Tatlockia sp.]|nr:hypothetical protein [Tatlockia sp.]